MALPLSSASALSQPQRQSPEQCYVELAAPPSDFAHNVHVGFARSPKSLPSVYFYDAAGSELFSRIMDLPEYYVTRVEREVLAQHAPAIVAAVRGTACDVIDLGAGDGLKTRILLEQLAGGDVRYHPVDVSGRALEQACSACARSWPMIPVLGVRADYVAGISHLVRSAPRRTRLVLLLGSNIGNFTFEEAQAFFVRLRSVLRPGDYLLCGFDLLKDPDVMQRAYDDAAGVTARFNLNLLHRIASELGSDIDPTTFRHYARFAPVERAMESYLISMRQQRVRVGKLDYAFAAYEPIRTEISCKYHETDVRRFARRAGFDEVAHFHDQRRWFLDALWQVPARPEAVP